MAGAGARPTSPGIRIVATTLFVEGSIRLIEPSPVFRTQTAPKPATREFGWNPTSILPTTRLVRASTRVTSGLERCPTHRDPSSNASPAWSPPGPTTIVAVTLAIFEPGVAGRGFSGRREDVARTAPQAPAPATRSASSAAPTLFLRNLALRRARSRSSAPGVSSNPSLSRSSASFSSAILPLQYHSQRRPGLGSEDPHRDRPNPQDLARGLGAVSE